MTPSLSRSVAGLARLALGAALGLALAAGVVVAPAAAQTPAAPAATPRAEGTGPALWVVRDADSTLYLFGTVHLLRPTTAWGSDRVDAAFDSADRLILEIANLDDTAAMASIIQQHGMAPDQPLSHQISSGQLTLLDNAARTIGLSALQLDPFRPWLAGLTLSVAPLVKAGYDPKSGVELVLLERARAAGKPVSGFETIDEQVRILAGLPQAAQLAFLETTLEDFATATTELNALVEAWARGDLSKIETIVIEPMQENDAVYQALLVRRNTNWADQIQTLLEGSGTVFIAVGAGHLAGEDSVQEILERRGVEVAPAP